MSTHTAKSPPVLLTKTKLWAAFFVQLNEAYQITVLLPMVVFMCRDFGIQPNLLGIYTSLLNASFMFCQFLVSYLWGSFSDKYGRRLALVSGLFFSTIAVLLVGFAKSYAMVMIARCLCGLFNGNLGVIKAWLSDITDSSNRSYAFSMIAISFGFGNVLGSMMGGLLIVTNDVDLPDAEYIPTVGVFHFWIFYDDFPFLLPCLLGSIISANALFWTLYQVKNGESQSRINRLYSSQNPEYSMGYERYNEIDSDLISMIDIDNNAPKSDICIFNNAVSIYETNNSTSLPILVEWFEANKFTAHKPLLFKSDMDKFEEKEMEMEIEFNSLKELVIKTDLFKTLFCYILIAVTIMMFREMNPVYQAQALLFNSQLIGYCQAWSGANLLIWTFCFQPYFLKRFQHRNMSVLLSGLLAITMLLMPSIYWTTKVDILDESWIALICAFGCETLMVVFASLVYVCTMCFINNSIPPNNCGKANGLAQSLASLVRAIGPVTTGFIWSESVKYIERKPYTVYWAYLPSFFGFVILAVHMFCFIKVEYQFSWEKQIEMKKMTSVEMRT